MKVLLVILAYVVEVTAFKVLVDLNAFTTDELAQVGQ